MLRVPRVDVVLLNSPLLVRVVLKLEIERNALVVATLVVKEFWAVEESEDRIYPVSSVNAGVAEVDDRLLLVRRLNLGVDNVVELIMVG